VAELEAMGDDPENSARSSSRVAKKERERLGSFARALLYETNFFVGHPHSKQPTVRLIAKQANGQA
jgi:hypothetical protein